MKKSTKITMIFGLTMIVLLATCVMAMAGTPAFTMKAPLPQDVGILDKAYVDFTVTDCRNCHGSNTADLHHMTATALDTSDPTRGCIGCHELTEEGTIATPINRDCFGCHDTSWHHIAPAANAGTCTACHDTAILAEQGTGLVAPEKPTYDVSLVTPKPIDCANCHNDFNLSWDPTTQSGTTNQNDPNQISHHGTVKTCYFCHDSDQGPTGGMSIRMCESCHTITTLHTIKQHTDSNDKCLGCHGTYMAELPPMASAAAPSVDGLDVTTQKFMGYVVVSGENFGATADTGKVYLRSSDGDVSAPASYWTESEVRFMVPDSTKLAAGNYDVVVKTGGKESNIKTLTVVANPYISGITPAMGLASTATTPVEITLKGSGFATGSDLAVVFAQGSFRTTVVPQLDATGDLIVQVPVGLVAGKYQVLVTNSIGTSNPVYYTVGAAPKINLLTPSATSVGKTVIVYGSNLSLGSKPVVKFGTTDAAVKTFTATKVYVTVPSMAAGATTVTVNNGFATSAPAKFTVK